MEMIKNIETVVEYSWEMFCTSKFVGEVGLFIFLWYQFSEFVYQKLLKLVDISSYSKKNFKREAKWGCFSGTHVNKWASRI